MIFCSLATCKNQLKLCQTPALRLLARGSDLLDLHDLSPGAARCAISWWLDQKGYWSGRHSLGFLA